LVAARSLARAGKQVVLVEEEAECGGLLRSFKGADGSIFDFGSHYLRQTNVAELDKILFGRLEENPEKWQRLPFLRNGSFFMNKLYEHSCSVDARSLSPEIYERGMAELMACQPVPETDCANNEEFLLKSFGPTFYEHIFRPAIKKFQDSEPRDLIPMAHNYFDMLRIIATTPERTRELKQSTSFDQRLAFHFSHEGQSGTMNYYPTTGGIGQWIEELVRELKSLNVRVLTGTRVEKVVHANQKVSDVILSDGEKIACDSLLWSAVPVPLLKASGLEFPLNRVRIRMVNLYYYVFDQPLKTSCEYFVVLDPDYRAFRVSCYPNLRSNPKDRSHSSVCVEVMGEKPDTSVQALSHFEQELKRMRIVESDTKVIYQQAEVARAGFPVLTPGFVEQNAALRDYLHENLKNCSIIGKGSGKVFFTAETLADTYRTLKERYL